MEELAHESANEESLLVVGRISVSILTHISLLVSQPKGILQDLL